ncbi:hypothetical protein H9N28_07825 [Rhodobacter capsulatus]|uniref:hypothetical protein n=1 Tax=Rhodobacter capsulatus TaxID=1061 RepID=UPI0006DC5F1A|nr:hypothetical protein [Rhodobacter capsulatus]KQB15651.1 hypothetical protein AP073_13425 [Rhodobacter capsulatus]KQB16410.1 hypothetical protein AP071_12410 [Rhodobacter capsulatus]PZX22567.1 hypothetical protein LY44_02880 [Rhodobacter capsulatus]QNR64708.1 hypothetical protein H9N28_07825 [Rhodobacter capsulatus]
MKEPTPKDQTQQEAAANPAAPNMDQAELAAREAAAKEAAAKEAAAKEAAAKEATAKEAAAAEAAAKQEAAKAAARETAARPKPAAAPKPASGPKSSDTKPAAEPVVEKVMRTSETDVAFALGGLAGNNAHGAGFLQAALEGGVHPRMISCTSGQIYWVWRYLQALAGGESLETHLAEQIETLQPFGQRDADLMHMALFGKSGVFRPSLFEWPFDVMQNLVRSLDAVSRAGTEVFWLKEMMSLTPARTLVPLFPDSFFAEIAQAFNETGIGILFNAYDPREGLEYVHANPSALAQLGIAPGGRKSWRSRTIYAEITPQAVRDGLWLYEYGFEGSPEGGFGALDGAYYRPVLLSELSCARTIHAVRPVNRKWLGPLPDSKLSLEDMKTEVAFNGIYAAERDRMLMVNRWIAAGILRDPRFAPIEIYEIEVETQRSFFDYVFESMEVFENARSLGHEAFSGGLAPAE